MKMGVLRQALAVFILLLSSIATYADEMTEMQQALVDMGYSVTVDGIIGNETKRQLGKFFIDNGHDFDGIITDKTFNDVASLRKKFYRPIPWTFHDPYDSIKWNRYDNSHAPRNLGKIGHVKIEKESDGNSYVSLTSKIGQLSNFNRGQDRYIKDRVELGLPPNKAPFNLDNRLLWYGFKVKSPSGKFIPNAHSVTFNQYKQIQKNAGRKKDCFPGMFWRMNAENTGKTWMAVTNEIGNKINKKTINTFINESWSKVKVGVYFTESEHGWLRAYVNDRLVYSYTGRTIMNQFKSCKPKHFENYLRIGVYRGSDTKKLNGKKIVDDQSDTLHFDDFIVTDNSREVDQILAKK